jgi:TolA-binding protein
MSADHPNSPAPLAEISQGPSAFEQFLDRNQKNLVILSILAALGAAGWIVYSGIVKSNEETAGADLTKAEDAAAFQAIASNHGNTLAARSALVLLADKQWTDNQQDAAIATLRKFISENPEHPAIPSARASLGAKLMTQGKAGDATTEFEAVVENPEARPVAPYALLCLGDLAAGAGDLDKAESQYKRIKTDFSDSDFAKTADSRLLTLRAKPPVEIAPPPKPETPAATNAPANGGAPNIQVTPVESPAGTGSAPNIQVTPVEPAPNPQPAPAPAPAENKPAETPAPAQP